MAAPQTPFTGFTPTLGTGSANSPATSGALISGESNISPMIAQLRRKPQWRPLGRLLRQLVGVAPGATAVENRTRVTAAQALNSVTTNGGLVPIETIPLLGTTVAGRATTAGDVTRLDGILDQVRWPTSYPTDGSGNGGGGKGPVR